MENEKISKAMRFTRYKLINSAFAFLRLTFCM